MEPNDDKKQEFLDVAACIFGGMQAPTIPPDKWEYLAAAAYAWAEALWSERERRRKGHGD